ncbi:hypothetical protein BDW22DRAFT_1424000 [Trametopsis cervina]|nr:hypothetical protein BDW22DRAFT_1424000 [Trametopsis cervina]
MFTWNTTLDDTSSLLNFSPYSDGAASGGWASYFTGIGYFNGKGGEDSQGRPSLHITSFPGASVSLQFTGTAVYLYGTSNCTSYSVTLDGEPVDMPAGSSSEGGVLFWKDGLTPNTHAVMLTANPDAGSAQQLAFDKAVFTNIGLNASATGLTQTTYSIADPAVQYSGQWTKQTPYNVPTAYMETTDPLASVSLHFTNASALAHNSPRNWGHWTYNVTLNNITETYNSSTWWLVPDATLFYQSNLDPAREYDLTMLNTGMQSYFKMSFSSFTVYEPSGAEAVAPSSSGSTPTATDRPAATARPSTTATTTTAPAPAQATTSKPNVGVIAGPVVAFTAVLLLALAAFSWWRRWRRRIDHALVLPTESFTYSSPAENQARVSKKRGRSALATLLSNGCGSTSSVALPPSALPPGSASRTQDAVEPETGQQLQMVDVNRIIELIAQHIDRPPAHPSVPPPSYVSELGVVL